MWVFVGLIILCFYVFFVYLRTPLLTSCFLCEAGSRFCVVLCLVFVVMMLFMSLCWLLIIVDVALSISLYVRCAWNCGIFSFFYYSATSQL